MECVVRGASTFISTRSGEGSKDSPAYFREMKVGNVKAALLTTPLAGDVGRIRIDFE